MWQRAAAGTLNGGEVVERRTAPKTSKAKQGSVHGGHGVHGVHGGSGNASLHHTAVAPASPAAPAAQAMRAMAPAAAPSSSFVPSHCEAPSFEGFEGNGANGANGAWQAPPTTNSERACRDPGRNWAQSFPWDASVNAALPKFGVPAFRPQQREAINACLAGKDVFVRMPTGGDIDCFH